MPSDHVGRTLLLRGRQEGWIMRRRGRVWESCWSFRRRNRPRFRREIGRGLSSGEFILRGGNKWMLCESHLRRSRQGELLADSDALTLLLPRRLSHFASMGDFQMVATMLNLLVSALPPPSKRTSLILPKTFFQNDRLLDSLFLSLQPPHFQLPLLLLQDPTTSPI